MPPRTLLVFTRSFPSRSSASYFRIAKLALALNLLNAFSMISHSFPLSGAIEVNIFILSLLLWPTRADLRILVTRNRLIEIVNRLGLAFLFPIVLVLFGAVSPVLFLPFIIHLVWVLSTDETISDAALTGLDSLTGGNARVLVKECSNRVHQTNAQISTFLKTPFPRRGIITILVQRDGSITPPSFPSFVRVTHLTSLSPQSHLARSPMDTSQERELDEAFDSDIDNDDPGQNNNLRFILQSRLDTNLPSFPIVVDNRVRSGARTRVILSPQLSSPSLGEASDAQEGEEELDENQNQNQEDRLAIQIVPAEILWPTVSVVYNRLETLSSAVISHLNGDENEEVSMNNEELSQENLEYVSLLIEGDGNLAGPAGPALTSNIFVNNTPEQEDRLWVLEVVRSERFIRLARERGIQVVPYFTFQRVAMIFLIGTITLICGIVAITTRPSSDKLFTNSKDNPSFDESLKQPNLFQLSILFVSFITVSPCFILSIWRILQSSIFPFLCTFYDGVGRIFYQKLTCIFPSTRRWQAGEKSNFTSHLYLMNQSESINSSCSCADPAKPKRDLLLTSGISHDFSLLFPISTLCIIFYHLFVSFSNVEVFLPISPLLAATVSASCFYSTPRHYYSFQHNRKCLTTDLKGIDHVNSRFHIFQSSDDFQKMESKDESPLQRPLLSSSSPRLLHSSSQSQCWLFLLYIYWVFVCITNLATVFVALKLAHSPHLLNNMHL